MTVTTAPYRLSLQACKMLGQVQTSPLAFPKTRSIYNIICPAFYWNKFNLLVVVQLLSCVQLFATPWTTAYQASLSFTITQSLFKLMSTELMKPSNHLILCRPLLLPPSIFPSIGVFSNELALHIRWPKYWSFSISLPMNNQGGHFRGGKK